MIKRLVTSVLMAAVLAGSFVVLAGCNTVEGAGKDIARGGNAIRDEAQEHKGQ